MRLRVKVRASARKEEFFQTAENAFEAHVKEEPLQHAANDRVRALVARHLNIPVSKVRIVAGMRSPNKRLEVID